MGPPTRKFRIVIAGGCHVYGYPVGEQAGFVRVAERALSPNFELDLELLPLVRLDAHDGLLQSLRQRLPDLLVLQLGNYEASMRAKKHFRRFVLRRGNVGGIGSSSSSSSSSAGLSLTPETCFNPTMRHYASLLCRQAYSLAAALCGKPLCDPKKFKAAHRTLFDSLREFPQLRILMISPLPCADTLVRRHRKRSAQAAEQEAAHAGVDFIDTAAVLASAARASRRDYSIYVDSDHLNGHGHALMGEELARRMHRILQAQSLPGRPKQAQL